jgi:hypothetical protein
MDEQDYTGECIELCAEVMGYRHQFIVAPGEDWRAVLTAQARDDVAEAVRRLSIDDVEVIKDGPDE